MPDLTLRHILKAPRARVWACWTQPDLLKQWFCPKPHFITQAAIELRPGGSFKFSMSVDGKIATYENCLLDIVPGEKLVMTDLMVGDHQPVAKPFLGYTAIVTLHDHPDGTEYIALARHRNQAEADRHDKMGFTEGWGICADQLGELAAQLETAK